MLTRAEPMMTNIMNQMAHDGTAVFFSLLSRRRTFSSSDNRFDAWRPRDRIFATEEADILIEISILIYKTALIAFFS